MKLAIRGGEPLLKESFEKTNNISEEEINAVVRVMKSGTLSDFVAKRGNFFLGGIEVKSFEKEFEKRFKVKHAVSVNSASTGLECALAAIGVTYGDEVIVPPYTMSATATSVMLRGAVPVFADIEETTFTINPQSIIDRISEHTKAIIVVNLFGHAGELKTIMEIAKKYNLKVIEDNAQAPGGVYHEMFAGTIADIGVFSFNFHKNIHSGEGGVCATNNDELAFRLQLARNHGEIVIDDYSEIEDERKNYLLGSNYRMSELHAAIAHEQLKKMDFINDCRITLAQHLSKLLLQLEGIRPPVAKQSVKHVYYRYPVLVDENTIGVSRQKLVSALRAEGLTIGEGYVKPIYLSPIYQKREGKYSSIKMPFELSEYVGSVSYDKGICPVCEDMHFNKLILLSDCRNPLNENDMESIYFVFKKVFDNINEIKES